MLPALVAGLALLLAESQIEGVGVIQHGSSGMWSYSPSSFCIGRRSRSDPGEVY